MPTSDSSHTACRPPWTLVGVLALLGGTPALAAEAPAAITVDGEASADLVPDIALLSLGIVAERPTAAAATDAVAAAAQAVVAGLKAEGIADADVTTVAIALDPVEPDPPAGAPGRMPRAFRAATRLRVTIRPASRAGLIASHMVDKGANTIDGIDYACSDEPRRLDDLRAAAMRDALHKAEVYTGALNLHLGRVVEITPLGGEIRPPSPMLRSASILAAKAVLPSAPGLLTLHAGVTVRWALDP